MTETKTAQPIQFSLSSLGESQLVTISGSLADEAIVPTKEIFLRLLGEKRPRILVDLGGIEYISSSGIGLLVSVLRRCREGGTAMALCGLRPEIAELFKLTRLNQVFEIFPDRAAALAAGSR
jgi:anti-sigma B factor antagonist